VLGAGVRLGLAHAARAVDEGQLVRVDVEVGDEAVGVEVGGGGAQQLPLRAHRDELARAHRERAGEQPREAGEQHDAGGHSARPDAQHEGEVRDEAVVGAEDRGAEGPGEAGAAALGESPHDLAVDPLVGRHGLGRVVVVGVGGAGFGALDEREHEDRAEASGEEAQHARAQIRSRRRLRGGAEQSAPVLLVPALGGGEGEQDVALLAGAAAGEVAVGGGLGELVGEVAAPAADLRGAGGSGVLDGVHHGISWVRARRPAREGPVRTCVD
jgi:hypothetical protein